MIIMKSVTMMLGELDYEHTYIENGNDQHFANVNLFILLLFAVIMPILLMNLLVGLAIGDLMQIRQSARLKRLAMQVRIVCKHQTHAPARYSPLGTAALEARKEISREVNQTLDKRWGDHLHQSGGMQSCVNSAETSG